VELVNGITGPETDDFEVVLSVLNTFYGQKVLQTTSLEDINGVLSITSGAVVKRAVSSTSIWDTSYTSTGSIICRSRPWFRSLFNLRKHT
jgi:hypothetical protein